MAEESKGNVPHNLEQAIPAHVLQALRDKNISLEDDFVALAVQIAIAAVRTAEQSSIDDLEQRLTNALSQGSNLTESAKMGEALEEVPKAAAASELPSSHTERDTPTRAESIGYAPRWARAST